MLPLAVSLCRRMWFMWHGSSLAQQMHVDRRVLLGVLVSLPTGVVALVDAGRHHVEQVPMDQLHHEACVQYLELAAHDETPLPVQLCQTRVGGENRRSQSHQRQQCPHPRSAQHHCLLGASKSRHASEASSNASESVVLNFTLALRF